MNNFNRLISTIQQLHQQLQKSAVNGSKPITYYPKLADWVLYC